MKRMFVAWSALLLNLETNASQIEEQSKNTNPWSRELNKRAPENDQILFTVQNNTPEIMPIGLRISVWDEYFKTYKNIEIGRLKKEVQPKSVLSVKQSECELLAWTINAFNALDLPLNCDFMIGVDFNWYKGGEITGTYSQSTSLCFGTLSDQKINGGFPIGGKFVVNEKQYVSHIGKEVKSFEVSRLCDDVNASKSEGESKTTDSLNEQPEVTKEISLESDQNSDDSWNVKLQKRTPENDQTLFTVQNDTSEIMPVDLSITIVDANYDTDKWIEFRPLKREVQPHSYVTFKQSECELLAWILDAYNRSAELPLNCQFMIGINFNFHEGQGSFGGSAQSLGYGSFSGHKIGGGFPIGGKFVVNEERYTSHLGKEVASFKVSRSEQSLMQVGQES